MQLEQLQAKLDGKTISSALDELLNCWEEGSSSQKDSIRNWIMENRREFLKIASDIDDPEELDCTIAFQYIKLKTQWIMFNTQLQYQVVKTGEADNEIMYKASAVTNLLTLIEEMINHDDLDRITSFLAKPVSTCEGAF